MFRTKSSVTMRKNLLFLAFVLMLLPQVVFGATETYEYSGMWPVLKQPWYFSNPSGIAIDSSGNVYVADTDNNRIQKFSSSGTFITKWGSYGSGDGQFTQPQGITTDSSGNVYVADYGNARIQKFSSNGSFIAKWGSYGTDDGQFYAPKGITTDNSGNVYVADSYNNRIQKFSANGTFIAKWGSYGTGDGQFNHPSGITTDSSSNVYVADSNNNRIQKFSSSGTFITKWGSYGSGEGQFNHPSGITTDSSGNVYVADIDNSRIQKFSSNGSFIAKWGSYGIRDGELNGISDIAIDSSGNIYVAEAYNNRIQKFSSNGTFVATWGSQGNGDLQFSSPIGITTDSSGNVYVADRDNSRIQKFSSNGSFIAKWGSYGIRDGELNGISDITIDSSGNIYVADTWSNRIQKFSSNGTFVATWGSQGNGDLQFSSPSGITTDSSGNVYVADTNNNRIQKFSSNGTFITKWGSQGNGDLQFSSPSGITTDSSGNVYVADSHNDRIQKFSSNGTFITKWGSYGSDAGQFMYPSGMATDSSGNIYVADTYNNRIQKFSSNGAYIATLGSSGSDAVQLSHPGDLSVATDGTIYVADTGNNRIQKFKPASATTGATKQKAIIVAGGGKYTGNYLWDATQLNANFAYRTLNYQGYTSENIYYLSSDTKLDLNSDGKPDVAGDATNANLQKGITEWAKDAESLVLYMVDHGGPESFRMSQTETLKVDELNTWINTYQQATSGKVTVIYDACQSGSFLSKLAPPSGKQRMLIMSAAAGESAYFQSSGILSFSYFFWNQVFSGATTKQAFDYAAQSAGTSISGTGKDQNPLLDDNNNGIGNETNDGNTARNHYIGKGIVNAEDMPLITAVTADQTLNGQTEATITIEKAKIITTGNITKVWATVRAPDFTSNPDNSVTKLPEIELQLNSTTNKYEGTYKSFTQSGTYTLTAYAEDAKSGISLPIVTTVKQVSGVNNCTVKFEARNNDYYLNVPIVTLSLNGSTTNYYAELIYVPKNDNQLWFKLTANAGVVTDISNFSSCQHSTITASGNDFILHLAKVDLNGTSIWVDLKYSPTDDGNLWFVFTGSGSN